MNRSDYRRGPSTDPEWGRLEGHQRWNTPQVLSLLSSIGEEVSNHILNMLQKFHNIQFLTWGTLSKAFEESTKKEYLLGLQN